MAKVGLDFGQKLQIADKSYRILNDGIDVAAVLGDVSFARIEGPDVIYEEVRENGIVRNETTGEVRGVVVALRSAEQKETVFVTVTEMSEFEIEDLKLNFRDSVELVDPVMSYSAIDGNDVFKLFASAIRKKVAGQQGKQEQPKKDQNQGEHNKQG
ncbi:conjugal transfer protein [Streptococcus dysgalactiae subsp. equisimilis]|uniref:conjugal transfer protein n=1 Tax=Streptococcus dysgalactiae TaxID=1334 RepID=UPI000807057B|nr:conjugal transfer protein [Streptococcus dysgalactiae]OBZ00641.1 conjugal transfer protein [Streptococcus dysgalactiae subsp. equisimilis]